MSYVIESGIPVPKSRKGGGRPPGLESEVVTALLGLEPGQSILFDDYNKYRIACRRVCGMVARTYVTRKVDGQGWRVWRTE